MGRAARATEVCEAIFFGDQNGVSESVRRTPRDFEGALREIAGLDVARHTDRALAERVQLVEKGHTDADRVQLDDPPEDF